MGKGALSSVPSTLPALPVPWKWVQVPKHQSTGAPRAAPGQRLCSGQPPGNRKRLAPLEKQAGTAGGPSHARLLLLTTKEALDSVSEDLPDAHKEEPTKCSPGHGSPLTVITRCPGSPGATQTDNCHLQISQGSAQPSGQPMACGNSGLRSLILWRQLASSSFSLGPGGPLPLVMFSDSANCRAACWDRPPAGDKARHCRVPHCSPDRAPPGEV